MDIVGQQVREACTGGRDVCECGSCVEWGRRLYLVAKGRRGFDKRNYDRALLQQVQEDESSVKGKDVKLEADWSQLGRVWSTCSPRFPAKCNVKKPYGRMYLCCTVCLSCRVREDNMTDSWIDLFREERWGAGALRRTSARRCLYERRLSLTSEERCKAPATGSKRNIERWRFGSVETDIKPLILLAGSACSGWKNPILLEWFGWSCARYRKKWRAS